jgi:hypothetical protein
VVKSRAILVLTIVALAALFASCGSAPKPAGSSATAAVKPGEPQAAKPGEASGDKTDAAALEKLYNDGLASMDKGQISEGITSFVTVLSEVSRAKSVSPDAREYARSAEQELTRIGAALNLAAGVEWMDRDKNQRSGDSISVGTPKALNPSVTLTYNDGGTRTVITGAPIVFEFVKGGGTLVTPVTTNDYGQANTTITALDNTKSESIVRATVSYRVKGFAYTFKGASRDFAYVPPVRKATLLVMERATMDNGSVYVSAEPVVLDRAFNVLKRIEFQYTPYNGKLLGEQYMKVFGGDLGAIAALGLEEGVSYLVMVLSDAYSVKQVELNGKKYDIFKSKSNGTVRVIRTADGVIQYSGTVQSIDGQANTAEKAAIDGFRNTADKLAEKLEADLQEIARSLVGK